MKFLLLFLSVTAFADEPTDTDQAEAVSAAVTLFENPAPVSVHANGDPESRVLYLGGYYGESERSDYKAKLDVGADLASIPGADAVYRMELNGKTAQAAKLVFNLVGTGLMNPASIKAPSEGPKAGRALVYVTMADNVILEKCRKASFAPEACPGFAAAREVGLASFSGQDGWAFEGTVLKGAGVASVLLRGQEIWLYYFQDGKLFRQKLGADGLTKAGGAEFVQFEGAPGSGTFNHADIVALRCEKSAAFAVTMLASTTLGSSLPFLVSKDGLHFHQAAESAVRYEWKNLAAGAQLPVKASPADCNGFSKKHRTRREIVYSEKNTAGTWEVKTVTVSLPVPELK